MTKYPKLIAALFAVCMLSVVSQVNATGIYPGVTFTAGCTMTNNDTGDKNYTFKHGALDYATAGLLMVTFQNSMMEFYEKLLGQVSPDVAAQMKWVGKLERDLAQ